MNQLIGAQYDEKIAEFMGIFYACSVLGSNLLRVKKRTTNSL